MTRLVAAAALIAAIASTSLACADPRPVDVPVYAFGVYSVEFYELRGLKPHRVSPEQYERDVREGRCDSVGSSVGRWPRRRAVQFVCAIE